MHLGTSTLKRGTGLAGIAAIGAITALHLVTGLTFDVVAVLGGGSSLLLLLSPSKPSNTPAITAAEHVALEAPSDTLDDAQVLRDLDDLKRKVAPVLPAQAVSDVGEICNMLKVGISSLHSIAAGDSLIYEIRATAMDYLPNTVMKFLRINKQLRDRKNPESGISPEDLLCEQLALIKDGLREKIDQVAASSAGDLSINGRFLREKFNADIPGSEL